MAHVLFLSDDQALGLSDAEVLGLTESGNGIVVAHPGQPGVYDLAAGATVLSTFLPDPPVFLKVLLAVSGLDGSGGDFEVAITINGRAAEPSPFTRAVRVGATTALLRSGLLLVPTNADIEDAPSSISASITSPNPADTAVTVTAYLLEVDTSAPGSVLAMLVKRGGGLLDDLTVGGGVLTAGTGGGAINPGGGGGGGGGQVVVDTWGLDMATTQIDSESGNANLTSFATILTHTPSASADTLVVAHIALGNNAGTSNDLTGAGGTFQFKATVDGREVQPSPTDVVFSAVAQAVVPAYGPFIVPANQAITIQAKSPNGGDTAVAYVCRLFLVETLTPGAIADAVCDEDLTGHTTADTVGGRINATVGSRASPSDVLSQIQSYDPPTKTEMDTAITEVKGSGWSSGTDTMEKIRDAIGDIGSSAGAGANQHTYTVEYNGDPLPGVDVWVNSSSTNSEIGVVASGETDADGEVTFFLDAGTWYFWRRRLGYNLSNPDTVVVS